MPAFISHEFLGSGAVQIALGLVAILFRVLAVIETEELERVLASTIVDALSAAHIEIKVAASCMRLSESQLRKQLRGEPSHHISLTRLLRLPFSFWLFFSPSLISIVYRKRMQEMADVLGDMKRSA